MPIEHIDGCGIYYEEHGTGAPVVFSHGLLWSAKMFAAQVDALSPTFRCIAYDHRGQGRSDSAPRYDIDRLTEDATALIDRLGAGPCHFVGLSMGGFVGLRLALRRPELLRSLTLIDSSADAEPRWNIPKYKAMEWLARQLGMRGLVPSVMNIMFGAAFLRDPARKAERRRQADELRALDPDRVALALESVTARHAIHDALDGITTPTLVLHGADDKAIRLPRAERTAAAIPGAKLVVVPRAGHTSTVEEPESISRELRRFLEVQ